MSNVNNFGRYGSPSGLATRGRVALIRTILTERVVADADRARLEQRLIEGINNDTADKTIAWLKRQPKVGTLVNVEPVAPVKVDRPSEPGFYRDGEDVYKVKFNKAQTNLYAEKVTSAGFEYDKGAIFRLNAAHRLSPQEVADYGIRTHVCAQCSTPLEDPQSKAVGLGTHCGPAILGTEEYKVAYKATLQIPVVAWLVAERKHHKKLAKAAQIEQLALAV